MKKLFILLLLLIGFSTSISTMKVDEMLAEKNSYERYLRLKAEDKMKHMKKMYSKGLDNFLDHLAEKESSGDPNVINTYGYIGKYQFGQAALKEVGHDSISVQKFRQNPEIFPEQLQDSAVVKLMRINKQRIDNLLEKYRGETINGIEITEAGLLAAAHLAGAGGVKRFLKTNGNYNPADGYGTRLSDYLKEFNDYKVNLNYV